MNHHDIAFAEHAKPRSLRAESADCLAPILPPASPPLGCAVEIRAADALLPAVRIVKHRRRLRITRRPTAQVWPRRAARRLLSPASSDRRGDA
jgi:hypothetical protein